MAQKSNPKVRVWNIALDEKKATLVLNVDVIDPIDVESEFHETQEYNLKVIPLSSAMEQIVDMLYPRKVQQMPVNVKPR